MQQTPKSYRQVLLEGGSWHLYHDLLIGHLLIGQQIVILRLSFRLQHRRRCRLLPVCSFFQNGNQINLVTTGLKRRGKERAGRHRSHWRQPGSGGRQQYDHWAPAARTGCWQAGGAAIICTTTERLCWWGAQHALPGGRSQRCSKARKKIFAAYYSCL